MIKQNKKSLRSELVKRRQMQGFGTDTSERGPTRG